MKSSCWCIFPHIGEGNEEIETHFARDGGITPVDVLLNTGVVIRRWHVNRKWLLCDVCDKSCSNKRHVTILPLNHMLCWHVRQKYDVVVKSALVFSSSVVSVLNRYSTLKLVFDLWHIGSSRPPVKLFDTPLRMERNHVRNVRTT